MIKQMKRGVLVGAAALVLSACGGGDADEGKKLWAAIAECKTDSACVEKAGTAYGEWAAANPEAAAKLVEEMRKEATAK